MMRSRWSCFLMCLLTWGTCGVVSGAGRVMNVPTTSGSKINIQFVSWLDACPPSGMVPMTVRIENGSDHAHDWIIIARTGYGPGILTTLNISVEAGKSVEVPFYPAVAFSERGGYGRSIHFSVSGYSTSNVSMLNLEQPSTVNGSGSSSRTPMPFLAMSSGLATRNWTPLVQKFDKSSQPFDATQVDMAKAPEDWRGFAGVENLWMTDGEWTAMSAATKSALLDSVALGGRVRVFCTDISEARLAAMKIPAKTADSARRLGAGKIEVQPWDGNSVNPQDALNLAIDREGTEIASERRSNYSKTFKLAENIAAPQLRAGLIFIFIAVFGTLVGPVNLYWFSQAGRRQRLFWITPLISLIASVLLVLLMIFQDGIGGDGLRRVLAIMQPAQNKMQVVQEQVARTGVLLGSSFTKHEPSWMEKIPLETDNYGFNPRGGSESGTTETDERLRAGDWFSSRSLQAHVLQTVRPSRGQIEVFPGVKADDPPLVLSSLGITLDTVYVIDEAEHVWAASNLATGEKKKMMPAKMSDYETWLDTSVRKEAGPVLRAALNPLARRARTAFATSSDASKFAVRTLDSIRWNNERVMFAGPYVKHDQP